MSLGEADVVVRRKQQAGSFALEPLADRLDFLRRRFLLGDQVVQAEHHQRVRVGQHAFVNRQLVAGLVDALEDGDRMSGGLADDLLESERGAMEQLQRSGNALQEIHLVPLGALEARPRDPADLGHGRKAIVQFGQVPVGFPGIAPRPVDAETSFARRVRARHVVLVVGRGAVFGCVVSLSLSFPVKFQH